MRKGHVVKMVVDGVDKMDSVDGTDKELEMVKVVANRKLFRGCAGQVVVTVDGVGVVVSSDVPLLVPRSDYEQMREHLVDGVQAVVLD